MITALSRLCWKKLPLSLATKRRAKHFLFQRMPWLFRSMPAYQRWRLFNPDATANHGTAPVPGPGALPPADPAAAATVRAIAMYLPQFYRILENDRWWGEGFSEWTNVRRGRPMYRGHYQPHVPHPDIGYYDLEDSEVLERQADMARRHGIHGFCFYYYWFNGRRLLEKPLDRMLRQGRPNFPFCICWANQNWTRAWDGLDHEVLLSQKHGGDEDRRFILDLIPLLRDPRYIRVDDRPLVIVYRASKLPNPKRTADVWRTICREQGLGDIHLCSVWSLGNEDPRQDGFDSVMQFPPLVIPCENLALGGGDCPEIHPGFQGAILDYRAAVKACLRDVPKGFPVFRGVMPSWDNTARRMERGTSWINSSPEAYGQWLRDAISLTCRDQPPDRRLVFINAWNEWAEGAHLEPDERHGYRYLEETARALAGQPIDAPSSSPDDAAPDDDSLRLPSAANGSPTTGAPTWLAADSIALERGLDEPKRHILFDLLFCQPGFHGGGEYGKAVFHALVRHAAEDQGLRIWAAMDPLQFMEPWVWDACQRHDVSVVAVRTTADVVALVNADRFDTFFTPGLVTYADHFSNDRAIEPASSGCFRSEGSTRIIGTIHDVRHASMRRDRVSRGLGTPSVTEHAEPNYARLFAAPRIDTIVTVSEHSRSEILATFGQPAARLVVLTPPAKRRPAAEPLPDDRHGFDTMNFALVVNAGRPEKNAVSAVAAFDDLFDSRDLPPGLRELKVVLLGIDTLADLGLGRIRNPRRFVAMPHVTSPQFEYLLQQSRFLVYPSFEEGFGYPPVEAMRFGRPSVVSQTGAMREVCGNAAVYCDPHDTRSISEAILQLAEAGPDRIVLENRLRHIAGRQREDLSRLVSLIVASSAAPAPPASA
jgi:glycosyltransferase involved in cell wall biosynthesis